MIYADLSIRKSVLLRIDYKRPGNELVFKINDSPMPLLHFYL